MASNIVLVTGATDGIGKQTAVELLKKQYTVLVHGRSAEKAAAAAEEIKSTAFAKSAFPVVADLSDLQQVRALAELVKKDYPGITVLVNNAGVFMKEKQLTPAGTELTFTVNHLAPFMLTGLLLDELRQQQAARIVTVSSVAHQRAQWDTANLQAEKQFDGYGAYALSKLCNVLFTFELAAKLKGTHVVANTLHPGVITTKLLKTGFGVSGSSLAEGAETSVYLASDPEAATISGKYFVKRRTSPTAPIAGDAAVRKQLWEISERLTGVSY
jgi:NAD(P)-dependent dehydrogenase (short-subunit alcohol dehydrogenase family)